MRVVNILTKIKAQRRTHCLLVRMIIYCLLRLTFTCPANMDVLASRTKYDHTMRSVLRYFMDAPKVETLAMNLLANWFAATDEENRVLQNSNHDLCKATCKIVMQYVCNDKHTEVVRYALETLLNMTSCAQNREQLVGLSLVNILISRLNNLHQNHNLLEEAVQVVEAISVSYTSNQYGGHYIVSPNAIKTLLEAVLLKARRDNATLLTSLARTVLPLLCDPKFARDFVKNEGTDVAIQLVNRIEDTLDYDPDVLELGLEILWALFRNEDDASKKSDSSVVSKFVKYGGIERILENLLHGERLTDRGMIVNLAILHDISSEREDKAVLKKVHEFASRSIDAINTYTCRPDLPDDTSCAIAVMCMYISYCSNSKFTKLNSLQLTHSGLGLLCEKDVLDKSILDSKRSVMVETVSHILQHASLSPRLNAGDRIESTEGWLLKKSNRLRRWNNRYFRLVPRDTDHGRVAVLTWTKSESGSRSPSPTRGNVKKKNMIEISSNTTVVWYVSTKDGRRKIRVNSYDDDTTESSIFLDCVDDKEGTFELTKWHDSISMAIRAAIEAKSVEDSMMVRCVNCSRRIPLDKIDKHSLMCKRKKSYDEKEEEKKKKKKKKLLKRKSSCIISYSGIGDDTEGALRICVEILVCLVTENINLKEKNSHLMIHEAEDAIKAVKKCPTLLGENGKKDAERRDAFCDAALDILRDADEDEISSSSSNLLRRGDDLAQGLTETRILSQVRSGRRKIMPMQYSEDKHLSVPKEGDDGRGPVDWNVLGDYLLV